MPCIMHYLNHAITAHNNIIIKLYWRLSLASYFNNLTYYYFGLPALLILYSHQISIVMYDLKLNYVGDCMHVVNSKMP